MSHLLNLTMCVLLKNVTNSIWHAFNILCSDQSGLVKKSKLKVLTANIGTLLDLQGVEKGLEHFRSTSSLNFEHYKYYLQKELFQVLPDNLDLPKLREFEERIDELCWLVCKKHFLQREPATFSDASVYKLFRIFCLLSDLILDNGDSYQVLLSSVEVSLIVSQFLTSLGLDWDPKEFELLCSTNGGSFRFATFLVIMETKYAIGVESGAREEAVQDLYRYFLHDVIKKGWLLKRGYLLPTLREYWFVLQPTELTFYKSQSERELCGTIALDARCRAERAGGVREKRFLLHAVDRTFELASQDHTSRLQWLSSLETAVAHSSQRDGYQRLQVAKRRNQRETESRSRLTQISDIEQTKMQLEAEKMARAAAEARALELQAAHVEEERRLKDLEEVRQRLEQLLEEEIQAKRDEEIVRNLQARVLGEEWAKREELEQLQEEQKLLLEQERDKRRQFESMQKENESQLQETEQRLRQLQDERLQLDKELASARSKMAMSEEAKGYLESRLELIGPGVRRTQSFAPSTRPRPVTMQPRAILDADL